MSEYAKSTSVSVARSKAEIEETLQRYGCTGFMSGHQGATSMIAFQIADRQVKFILPMPDPSDGKFWRTPTGRRRDKNAAHKEWEQSCRQRWRALTLCIKAKLEAVDCGIVTFDQEFLAHIVAGSGGQTIGQQIIPQIEAGRMPQLKLEG